MSAGMHVLLNVLISLVNLSFLPLHQQAFVQTDPILVSSAGE